ncbi:membrane-targeted effector domain-containing toxin [Pseudomonas hormoni]|uniref:Membrane-targeted effector domain-containing toxin n=1 Tax=Pseudomonas hormoni TaxID=3093767 RepID=A0ABX8F094_9PSED|nr:membrane-targeted effector domain-containing toxin [Pseudomonas hormoni]QVW24388.1 membrane-targeted effector domain-containing toxin [Pseudomonas hormoni]
MAAFALTARLCTTTPVFRYHNLKALELTDPGSVHRHHGSDVPSLFKEDTVNSTENTALPDSSDMLALKALVPALVEACPDMYEMARGIAKDILVKHGITTLEPEQVYYHRFHLAQSSSKTFTGWEHLYETPKESMTLPQLVIQRFSVHDQDNADLLDLNGGFYSVGADAGNYNETNEVRLHGNEVLKDFWAINFSDLYKNKVASFWKKHDKTYRALAKCTFLAKAMEDREGGRLSDENFKTVIKAVASNVSWPVTRQMLESEAPVSNGLRVTLLKVGDFVATDILCIVDDNGRQILYVPGEIWGFHSLETPRDVHWWILSAIKGSSDRQRFMAHFQVADHDITQDAPTRQQSKLDWLALVNPLAKPVNSLVSLMFREPHIENVGLTHVLDLLFNAWHVNDHHLIDHASSSVTQDAFTFLSDAVHARMISDSNYMLYSNGDLRKKLWVGYLNAFGRMFGPLAAVGWPVALAVVGAGIANVGLNIDQAVNGKTPGERKAGVTGAIVAAIDTVFNATFIKGSGRLPAIAEAEAFIAPEEQLSENAIARAAIPKLEEIVPQRVLPPEPQDYLDAFKTEITEATRQDFVEQKLRNIILTPSGKTYIYMRRAGQDGFYQVRYVGQMKRWVIIDPANPYSFYRNVPVRQNEALQWEPVPRSEAGAGLSGGGKIFGLKPWGQSASPLPKVEIPPTSYELPEQSKAAMTPLAEGRTEAFPLDAKDASERPFHAFRDLRRGLYDDAITFYADPSVPPRPAIAPIKPSTSSKDIFKRLLADAPGLVVGQERSSISGQQLLIDNMQVLSKQKIKTLYLDRLLTDIHQADLDLLHESGKMPESLERYLTELDATRGTDLTGRYGYMDLVRTAQKNHIRVQAIDCMASARFPRMDHTAPDSTQKMMNYFSDTIISIDQTARGAHKWVALMDETRVNTFDDVAGLSELTGTPGLRIEDVPAGKTAGMEQDPGKKMLDELGFPLGEVKSDLRLRLHALPPVTTARTVEQALPGRGMFTIQEVSGKPQLYHRSGSGALVTTDIQKDKGGLFIVYPRWSASGRHFDNIQQLSDALQEQGMTRIRVRIDAQTKPGVTQIESETVATPDGSVAQDPALPAPKTPLVTSPYDVPPKWRANLKNAAGGFQDKLLPDSVDVTHNNEAFQHFKGIRKRLYEDAARFYADPQLPPRPDMPSLDPHVTQGPFIRIFFEESQGLVIGESHAGIGSKQFLIDNMQALAEQSVKTLYMEHLLTDFHQAALDAFAETSVMPRDVETYLTGLDAGHLTDPLERYTFLTLVREANKHGIRIQAIDSMASYRLSGMRVRDATARHKMMNFHARTIIRADQAARGSHKWIALMGNSHSNIYQGVAGVSELEGVFGLRVEDVAEGLSNGIEPDPGINFTNDLGESEGFVQGDLRLQVETPWVLRTSSEIDTLLSRPGMYTLKREPGNTLIVHRGRNNVLVSTPLISESGRVFIERPSWPEVDGKRFESVAALLEALKEMGLTLAGWSKPL